MQFTIDGITTDVQPGESLLTVVRRLGLDSADLRTRPLAANIAGETFTLNYVPLREEQGGANQRVTLRRAIQAQTA
jgi:predicted xylose isomerase-like sugar epimerase